MLSSISTYPIHPVFLSSYYSTTLQAFFHQHISHTSRFSLIIVSPKLCRLSPIPTSPRHPVFLSSFFLTDIADFHHVSNIAGFLSSHIPPHQPGQLSPIITSSRHTTLLPLHFLNNIARFLPSPRLPDTQFFSHHSNPQTLQAFSHQHVSLTTSLSLIILSHYIAGFLPSANIPYTQSFSHHTIPQHCTLSSISTYPIHLFFLSS